MDIVLFLMHISITYYLIAEADSNSPFLSKEPVKEFIHCLLSGLAAKFSVSAWAIQYLDVGKHLYINFAVHLHSVF